MKHTSTFVLTILLATASAFLAQGCSNAAIETNAAGKAYITLGASASRTVLPTFDTANFNSYVLTGSLNDGEVQTLGSWYSLNNVSLELLAGSWDFTLACKNGSAVLSGSLENVVIAEGNNPLHFVLSPLSAGSLNDYGIIQVTVKVPSSVHAVTAGLFDVENDEEISEFKAEDLSLSNGSVLYKKQAVSVGSYILRFFMYGDKEKTVLLNEYSEVVNVASQASSTAQRAIEAVNESYSIEYEVGEGKVKEGVSYQRAYSIFSDIKLLSADDLEYADHVFVGWYENADYSGERVTSIAAGTQTGNKTYYAKWAVLANYSLASDSIADKIRVLEKDGAYTIKATGNCSSSILSAIATALRERPDITVDLDLSATTGLASVASKQFENCSNLTSLVLPVSVTSMGSAAFAGCGSLTSITIPFVGATENPSSASSSTVFGYIFGTTSYTGSVAVEQRWAAQSSSSSSYKNTYYIPASLAKVTVLGGKVMYGAFYNCKNLTEINLADGISVIGDYAFYYCSGIKGLVLPSSVTAVGTYMFAYCSALESMEIPAKVQTINTDAFYRCTSLASVDFSKAAALKKIDNYAFSGCSAFTGIVIPESVTSIGQSVFNGCSALEEITLPFAGSSATATSVSSASLFGYIFGSGSYTGSYTAIQRYPSSSSSNTSSVSYVLPSSLRKVTITKHAPLGYTFYGCEKIEEINIPSGLTKIPEYIFYGCSALKAYAIPESVTAIGTYAFYNCSALEAIVLPEALESLGSYSFYGASSIKAVAIPAKLAAVSSSSFYGCTSLASVDFSKAAALKKIEGYAFSGCSSLSAVSLPETLTSIGNSAFYGCSALTSFVVPDSVTTIGSAAFGGCSGLREMTVPFVGGTAVNQSYTTQETLFGYIFSTLSYEGGTSVKQEYRTSSTSNTANYTTYYLPTSLKKLTVTGKSSSKIAVQERGLKSCSTLEEIIIEDGSLEGSAFAENTGLKRVRISGSATSLPSYAFSKCSALESVELPESLTTINTYAFNECSALALYVPASVTKIESNAFYKLKSVHYKDHETTDLYGALSLEEDYEIQNLVETENDSCHVHREYDKYCKICKETVAHVDEVIEDHNYVDGACTKCGVKGYVTVTPKGRYKFTESNGKWTSDNKGKSSTTASTIWTVAGYSKIKWTVSSEKNYDKLIIKVDGVEKVSGASGSDSGTISLAADSEHTVEASYSKDGSSDSGSDCATLTFE